MQFTNQSMQEIIDELRTEIDLLEAGDMITFKVLDPDEGGTYAGESITIEEKEYIYRGYKSWVSLAELLKCKMHTPQSGDYPFITLHFEKLQDKSFHDVQDEDKKEKYGTDSTFFAINKMEEPSFLYYYLQALKNVKIDQKKRLLNLGINRGDRHRPFANRDLLCKKPIYRRECTFFQRRHQSSR